MLGGSGNASYGGASEPAPPPTPVQASRKPRAKAEGSLFVAPTADPSAQACVYIECTAVIRAGDEPFTSELRVSRTDDDADDEFPPDVVFAVDAGSRFEVDAGRFAWCDRSGRKRYALDVEDEGQAAGLRIVLARALWERMKGESSEGVEEKELMAAFERPEPEAASDLLKAKGELIRADCELYRYDVEQNVFARLAEETVATINLVEATEGGVDRMFKFYIYYRGSGTRVLECDLENGMSAQFHAQELSMVWIMTLSEDVDVSDLAEGDWDPDSQICMSVKFNDAADFTRMQNQYAVALFEVNNQASMDTMKLKDEDRDYIISSARTEYEPMEMDSEDDSSVVAEDEELAGRTLREDIPAARASLGVAGDGDVNSQLAVAYNNDRTFVVRGNKLGVLSHAGSDGVEFRTTVNFQDKAAAFRPSKILLHEKDSSMLVLDQDDPSKIRRMDLDRGEIVETWDGALTGGTAVNSLQLTEKYANLTHNQEFMGLNQNQLLRMDPRSKEFIVQSKKYATGTRARLEAFATTGAGYIVTASQNGDIRLFDSVGKNAKTHLPGLGDRVFGVDCTEDGRYVLATTTKYLLVIDTHVKGAAKHGFQKSMGKDKPKPIVLTISPEDRAKHRMGDISFTTAHFNTGASLERSIVTSTGPFIVTWSFRHVKLGRPNSYQIKRFKDDVVADQFAYGNDGKIIVTLPNDVTLNSFTPARGRRSSAGRS